MISAFIQNGLRSCMALGLLAVTGQALAVDYADYSRPSNVIKKIFSLSGDFGNCGGSGAPDTEVRTFSTADLGGGVTKEIRVLKRYVGGPKGTLCITLKQTFIKTATELMLVQQQKYNKVGDLIANVTNKYDPVTCSDCGIVIARSDMVEGVEWASGNEWYETVGKTNGIVLSKGVLIRAGFDETINEGTAKEETFLNCMEVWEDRHTKGEWGNRSQMRRACQNIGMVVTGHVDTTSGTPVERLWVLKSYVQK